MDDLYHQRKAKRVKTRQAMIDKVSPAYPVITAWWASTDVQQLSSSGRTSTPHVLQAHQLP